jgi:hypothetical protein
MSRTIGISVAALVLAALAAAGGFLYGTRVGEARANAARQAFFQERLGGQLGQGAGLPAPGGGQFPQGGQRPGGFARGGVAGEVAGVQGDTIELTTPDGPVKVLITEQTVLRKVTTLSLDELQPGEQVVVIGDRDAQGNLVARSVQVGVAFRPGQ